MNQQCFISYFSKTKLLVNSFSKQRNVEIRQRLGYIFNKKPKWTFEEISPFVDDFVDNGVSDLNRIDGNVNILSKTHKKDLDAIMLKYSRVSSMNNQTYYTLKGTFKGLNK